jgi:hypothetical protein
MNVVIMQPFYLFLRKHFHQIYRADIYIFMDDTQFVKNAHHNRNRIKGPNGLIWLTVPVLHSGRFGQCLKNVEIDNSTNWRRKHWQSIKQCYARAPYFRNYAGFFEDVYAREWHNLCDLNIYLIKNIAQMLGMIHTEFCRLSDLNIHNDNPTQRLIDICEKVGASRYIIGTRAKDYMEEWRWEKTDVEMEYFEPSYPQYPQLYGEFLDNCAIIDLLFNCGPESYKYIWGGN